MRSRGRMTTLGPRSGTGAAQGAGTAKRPEGARTGRWSTTSRRRGRGATRVRSAGTEAELRAGGNDKMVDVYSSMPAINIGTETFEYGATWTGRPLTACGYVALSVT